MNILLDANILLRLADPASKSHTIAAAAVLTLRTHGDILQITPQCVYEFWVVATRPIANNGLGLSIPECLREVANLEASFQLLDDKPTLFAEWKAVVSAIGCHGKIAHDARYVAAMRTHGLTHLLTFNASDFSRFPGLIVLDPNNLGTAGSPSKIP
jgi:predicted nucleic acid-binding protein